MSHQTPEQTLRYRKTRREVLAEKQRRYRAKYPERTRETARLSQRRRVENGKLATAKRSYKIANPGLAAAGAAQKKAAKLGLECRCCTARALLEFYNAAKTLAKQVDHIKAFRFMGLHCTRNLQLLTTAEHVEKTRSDQSLANLIQRLR